MVTLEFWPTYRQAASPILRAGSVSRFLQPHSVILQSRIDQKLSLGTGRNQGWDRGFRGLGWNL